MASTNFVETIDKIQAILSKPSTRNIETFDKARRTPSKSSKGADKPKEKKSVIVGFFSFFCGFAVGQRIVSTMYFASLSKRVRRLSSAINEVLAVTLCKLLQITARNKLMPISASLATYLYR